MAKPSGCLRIALGVPLALIAAGLGLWLLSNLNKLVNHETVEGVIVQLDRSVDSDGDDTYTPTYEYVVGGTTYQYRSRVSYGGLLVPEIGDRRTILYNPANPADATVRSMLIMVWLPLVLLAIPLAILGVMLWMAIRRRRRANYVPTHLGSDSSPPWATSEPTPTVPWEPPSGDETSITAMFMGTEPSQMDADGNVRYRIKARAEIEGSLVRFRSGWLDTDPTLYYMEHGNQVEILIDPNDPTSYEVVLPPVE